VKAFAQLFDALDASTSSLRKLDALVSYLRDAAPEDAAWAVYLLAGGKPRQTVPVRFMREVGAQAAGLAPWLFQECYDAVGDLAETIARVLPPADTASDQSLAQWMTKLLALRGAPEALLREALLQAWSALDGSQRFVFNKLITGGLRVGVSRQTVVRALAQHAGVPETIIAQRMIGYTDAQRVPNAQGFVQLIEPHDPQASTAPTSGHPYPFYLAHALIDAPDSLGSPHDWQVEWKWDGIRAQIVLRQGRCWIWSRGEELITERFPEVAQAASDWMVADPQRELGVVLDGELLAWDEAADRPMDFASLQRRVQRRQLGARLLREVPVVFVAYDLLEWAGVDIRTRPMAERRHRLEAVLGSGQGPRCANQLGVSQAVSSSASTWDRLALQRESSRNLGVEGFMLKRLDSTYGVGRTKGEGGGAWWKWKVQPLSVDAVMIYAQRGHGRRASLYTDYTFAVWDHTDAQAPVLVPFAKAYSGLTDEEIRRVDAIVRKTTTESFGPVRSLTPTLVFELGFEGIAQSPRHKSGIAVRFPRMLRWRTDKAPHEADTLDTLRSMLVSFRGAN